MKNVFSTIACLLFFCLHIPVANATTICGPTSVGGDHTGVDAANGRDYHCLQTPETLSLTFYELGMCTSNVTPSDRSGCTPIFKNTSGKEIDLSQGAIADLVDEVTLTEGTYTHGYLVVDHTVKLSVSMEFSSSRSDDGSGNGKYCFTDGRSINSSPAIFTCDTSPDPELTSETMTLTGCTSHSSLIPNYTYQAKGVSVTTDLYMINSSGLRSTSCADDFAFFAVQPFSSPVSVSANTQGIDVAISLSGAVSVGFTESGDRSSPRDAMFNGMQFTITAN